MKRTLLALSLTLFGFAFVGATASADATADTVHEFGQYITYLQKVAPQALTLGPLDGGVIYIRNETRLEFSAPVLTSLMTVANQQASFWSDTVLDGEVQTQGALEIDKVEGLYSGSTLIGYRLTYGQTGFAIDSCKSADSSTCHLGEVRESAFVTPDFKHVELDHGSVATLQF